MVFDALRIAVLTALLFTLSANAGLTVSYKAPAAVNGVQDFKVIAKITNTGAEALKVIDDPRSLISKRPVNKFSIGNRRRKGARPAFSGVRVKYSPEAAVQLGAFTTLAPGASVSVTHDLSEAYNFTLSGVGEYEIEADTSFYILKTDGEVGIVHADSPADAPSTTVEGALVVARRELDRRAQFTSCSASQQALLNTAFTDAQSIAQNALTHLKGLSSSSTRYTTWFGTYTASRKSTVQTHFQNIVTSGFSSSSFTYNCACTDSSYAYVYPAQFGKIYLCSAFWNAPALGTDSKAGTLVHESSHFTKHGGTDDKVYGQTGAKNLAKTNPASAVMNADSHEYFAENTPAL